jgi:hypothetical protein
MATIDSNIALGVKPLQVENPMNQYAALSQIQSSQQANQLNALKMQEYERGLGEENKLRALLSSGADLNSPETIRKMYEISPTKGLEFQTKQQTIKKTGLEATKLESEIVDQRLKQSRQFLDNIDPSDPNAPTMYMQWHKANHADPILGPMLAQRGVTEEQSLATIQNAIAQGPQAFSSLLNQSKLGVEKFAELNKPQVIQENLGGTNRVSTVTPYGGAPTVISTTNKTMTPGERAVDQRTRENQALQYGENVVANTVTDAAGNVTQFNRFGKVIGTPGAVGKPSATFEKTAELKKQLGKNLDMAITNLDEITKDKGLIDQSTGSGAGRLYDTAQGFIGNATEGAIAIAKLKPIADMVLKMVPRFEGPQSDRDTTSYKEAAGQLANPDLPTAIRKAAGKEVLRIMKERKNQFVSETMSNEGLNASTNKAPPSGFVVDK